LPDYCTLWLDRLWHWDWSECCRLHDIAYAQLVDKDAADWALAVCVDKAAPIALAIVMLIGLRLFGRFFYPRTK